MTETDYTLVDFPNEIVERFIPDHKPKSISALKLVCKRFYYLLTNDIYYKCYLRYPEKNYLCEMKREENSVKEVIEEIKSGALGKWKGYLTLENIHLANWRCGNITHSTIVQLPELYDDFYGFNIDGVCWHQLIDEDNEHWLLNLRDDGAIVLLNITDKPKMFVEREMYGVATECVRLLPGQIVCISYNMGHIVVLDIVNDGDEISLQYNFDFSCDDILDLAWIFVTGKRSCTSQNNLFVRTRQNNVNPILSFRDLKTGIELENIRLFDYELLKKLRNVPARLVFKFCEAVEFPYIVMEIHDDCSDKTMVIIFNIETMQPTAFIEMMALSIAKIFIVLNEAYIFTTAWAHWNLFLVTHLYRLSLESHPNTEEPKIPELLFQFWSKGIFCGDFSKHQMFAFEDTDVSNKVHVVSVSDTGVNDLHVFLADADDGFSILNVIGSDVLIIQSLGKNKPISSFKVTGGQEEQGVAVKVIDWSKVFHENGIEFVYPCPISSSIDLSTLVFYDKNNQVQNCLAIFHF